MAGLLDGRVALVTGAASGIGRASAVAFAREGAKVVVSDVAAEGGQATVDAIVGAGGSAAFVRADVSSAADVEGLVRATVETYGRLDCAHNNAGILGGSPGATHEYPDDVWARVLAVNLTGVWLCMKHELARMVAQGAGAIVNTASSYGLGGAMNGGASAYVASKHGVVGLTKTAAVEYARQGIRINAVCPSGIRTPMLQHVFDDPAFSAQVLAAHPMGRAASPEEVAEAVVWLCSDAASFVTGAALPVDGGYVAR